MEIIPHQEPTDDELLEHYGLKGGPLAFRVRDVVSTKDKPGKLPLSPSVFWAEVKRGRIKLLSIGRNRIVMTTVIARYLYEMQLAGGIPSGRYPGHEKPTKPHIPPKLRPRKAAAAPAENTL